MTMADLFITLGVGALSGFIAGYGWGRSGVAETVARLVAEIEIARQTGTLRENATAATRRAGPFAIKRLLHDIGGSTVQPHAAPEHDAREEAVNRGAQMLIDDAKANGRVLSLAEAREAARSMMADVGLGS